MSISALTSAFATAPKPANAILGTQQERPESALAPQQGEESQASSVPRVVFNPRSHYNASAGVFVMEYRSPSSGEVERQFPDEQQLRAYENARKLEAAHDQSQLPDRQSTADTRSQGDGAAQGRTVAAQPQGTAAAAPQGVRIQV